MDNTINFALNSAFHEGITLNFDRMNAAELNKAWNEIAINIDPDIHMPELEQDPATGIWEQKPDKNSTHYFLVKTIYNSTHLTFALHREDAYVLGYYIDECTKTEFDGALRNSVKVYTKEQAQYTAKSHLGKEINKGNTATWYNNFTSHPVNFDMLTNTELDAKSLAFIAFFISEAARNMVLRLSVFKILHNSVQSKDIIRWLSKHKRPMLADVLLYDDALLFGQPEVFVDYDKTATEKVKLPIHTAIIDALTTGRYTNQCQQLKLVKYYSGFFTLWEGRHLLVLERGL